MFGVFYVFLGFGIFVKQAGNLPSFQNVFPYNLFTILGFYLCVKCVVRNNLYNRTFFAKTKTTGSNHLGIVFQTQIFQFCVEVLNNLVALRGPASGTSANQQVHFVLCHKLYFFSLIV
ncbi:hypothetical protein SDC9_73492 [bioreactor metagenome]|uniref:Uncharacterized protein n=1 Tax=bioreactor metagenome TaxID=1076179 RepID=A0A644YFF6_9ZZZZ